MMKVKVYEKAFESMRPMHYSASLNPPTPLLKKCMHEKICSIFNRMHNFCFQRVHVIRGIFSMKYSYFTSKKKRTLFYLKKEKESVFWKCRIPRISKY